MNQSPPQIPQQPKKEKWQNLSAKKCNETYGILLKLQGTSPLPEGKKLDNLGKSDPETEVSYEAMEYAERVLLDDEYWESLPSEISSIIENRRVRKNRLRAELYYLILESKSI